MNKFEMKAQMWIYPGHAAWHFLTLPKQESTLIKEMFSSIKRGWGSLPVEVTIGKTVWKTSIFPDKKSDAYLLPVKVDVRKKEKIEAGDMVEFLIKILGI